MGDEAEAEAMERMPRTLFPPPPPMEPTAPLAPLDSAHPYFFERGVHEATARHFGIGYFRGAPPFGRRIVAPLHDAAGQLVGHIGRAIDDSVTPRYLFQRGVRRNELVFNLHRVKQSNADTVVVVEGIFDALAVHQVGIPNVVSTLGCEVTANQRALLSRFRRVVVLFDGDDAGRRAAESLEDEFARAVIRLQLPKADPASIKGILLLRLIEGVGVDGRAAHEPLRRR
jgi:DNA primase